MKPPNSKKIARILAHEIESVKYPIGSTLPTRYALAERFGVARGTVDRAVSELCERGLVESRRRAGSIILNTSRVIQIGLLGGSSEDAAKETHNKISCTSIPFESIATKADREKLTNFDGLIWYRPNKQQLLWSEEMQECLPQILINRKNSARNFVSTDHAEAVFQITQERIAEHRSFLPVFLESAEDTSVGVCALRRKGFIRACREYNLFYEIIQLPDAFDLKIEGLRKKLNTDFPKQLLMVSDSSSHTGAVMQWVRESKRHWLTDILYSDFDNSFPENVWGVVVTSFIQDYSRMLSLAVNGLVDIIQGREEQVQILQLPIRRLGDT